jgi:hypothetical protein
MWPFPICVSSSRILAANFHANFLLFSPRFHDRAALRG